MFHSSGITFNMKALEVEEFMKSQKEKITEEKIRLANTRGTKSILPSDSIALERSNKLRKERQSEYQAYIKSRDQDQRTISELRTELSHDREAELGQRKVKLDLSSTRLEESNADGSYAALQAKKLTEERRYRGAPHSLSKPRKDKDADKEGDWKDLLSNNKLACKVSDSGQYQKSTWNEEEKDLVQWTRNKGPNLKPQPGKENTPPGFYSMHASDANSRSMLRSISDPITTTAVPLPGLSVNDNHVQKMKKMRYAEDLRNQIREKKATSGRCNDALDGATDQYLSYGQISRERAGRSVTDNSSKATCSVPCHIYYGDRECVGKPASMATRSSDNSKQDYPFYSLPPPPPSFQGRHGVPWIAPMYPYPTYYDHESHSEMYRHPYYYPPPPHSYPPAQNCPPPHHSYPPSKNRSPPPGAFDPYRMPPSHHHHEPRKHLAFRDRGEENHDLMDHVKRSYSPFSPRHENSERGGSPSWTRERDKDPKINKMSYREELEKQMREKKERKLMENIAKKSLDKKRQTDIYDPFGKGGCGAPVRDQYGNLVADLNQMRKINDNRFSTNSLELKGDGSDISETSFPQKASQHTILTYSKRNDEDIKKSTQVCYRDFLRQQVKEKEEFKKKEKERQRIEEEKELEHLERDRKRIHEEYQRDLALQKVKAEQASMKNEAIMLEAEEERQKILMQQERETVQEEKEQRSFADKELVEKLSYPQAVLPPTTFRSTSPPIPTLRHRMNALPSVSAPDPQPQNHLPSKNSGDLLYQPASTCRLLEPSSPDATEQIIDHPSPPVPTLRKKKSNPRNTELETSKANSHANVVANTQICRGNSQVLGGTRLTYAGVSGNHSSQSHVGSRVQDHTLDVNHESVRPHYSNGTDAVGDIKSLSSRRQLSALESEDILTKLGAIRLHLQEELARQNCESQSDIFERTKRHEPRIAAPLKSKCAVEEFYNKLRFSSPTKRGFADMNTKVPRSESTLAEQQGALLRHEQCSSRRAQINIEKQKGSPNRKYSAGKDSCGSTEGSTLPPELSPRSVGYPFSNNNDSQHLTRTHDKASLPSDFSCIPQCSVFPDIDGSSMATRNEERIKRLETILNSGTYIGSLERDKEKEGDRRLTHIHRSSNSAIRHDPSRKSERSLESETQHLPA